MRLFTAIAIPQSLHPQIASLRDEQLTGARWTSPEQWHITLHFIGETKGETKQEEAIMSALQTVQYENFQLTLRGVGTFPAQGKPRVLWVGIDAPPTLQQLHKNVGAALAKTGFQPEKRSYHPHLTLARFKSTAPTQQAMQRYQEQHTDFMADSFSANEVILYESKLASSGAQYHVRRRFALNP